MITARNDGLQTPQPLENQPQQTQALQTQPPQTPLVETLRNQIRKLETAGRADGAKTISTGCEELDGLLPEGGLVTGTITEWLTSAGGCGAELLSLLAAKQACADGGALVVVDSEHRFHPAAATAWGVDLGNVVVIRGASEQREASKEETRDSRLFPRVLLWAIDQSLRCPAVAAVWGRLGHVSERWLRRFQLSAEQSGAMGMFVRPASAKGQPGWSEVQMEIAEGSNFPISYLEPRTSLPHFDRFLSLRLLRVRSGHAPMQPITLQIDFTTGKVQTVTKVHEQTVERPSGKRSPHSVRLASQLAHPKTGGRRQRA